MSGISPEGRKRQQAEVDRLMGRNKDKSSAKGGCGWFRQYLWKPKEELETMTAYELEQFRIKQRLVNLVIFSVLFPVVVCPMFFCIFLTTMPDVFYTDILPKMLSDLKVWLF